MADFSRRRGGRIKYGAGERVAGPRSAPVRSGRPGPPEPPDAAGRSQAGMPAVAAMIAHSQSPPRPPSGPRPPPTRFIHATPTRTCRFQVDWQQSLNFAVEPRRRTCSRRTDELTSIEFADPWCALGARAQHPPGTKSCIYYAHRATTSHNEGRELQFARRTYGDQVPLQP